MNQTKHFTESAEKKDLSKTIAEKTSDAYSCNRYRSWEHVTRTLLKAGFDARETEAILRSKWTRWAADASGAANYATSKDLMKWIEETYPNQKKRAAAVAQLVKETF